jgi:hypothetical protein
MVADTVNQDLGAAAGDGVESRTFEPADRSLYRKFGDCRDLGDFGRGE